jgi:hypothetical protein
VYRSATQAGSYSLIATQNITDMTYYDQDGTSTSWYKITYYDSNNEEESGLSTAIQGQSTTYTTVKMVESLLQLPTRSDTTNPSIQEMTQVINRVEDKIDFKTGHAWRKRYSYTNSGRDTTAQYEYHDVDKAFEYQTGTPIYLQHRHIYTLDTNEGDILEFWNGAEWENWTTDKTEGRNNDYWLDYRRGIVYMRGTWYVRKPQGLRIKYRYGETFVPGQIEDIATKWAAIDVLTGMDPRAMIVQEDGSITHDVRVSRWRNEVRDDLNNFKEWKTPSFSL